MSPSFFLAVVEAAPKYAEGRGVRLEIRNRRDVKPLIALAGIKLAH